MSAIRELPLARLIERYPAASDFLANLNLEQLDVLKTLDDALLDTESALLGEFGLEAHDIPAQLAGFLVLLAEEGTAAHPVSSVTIFGGRDKSGNPEGATLEIKTGEIISIVGPTGAGKSRLLADIECLAQGDTPTGRKILLNGKVVSWDERIELEGKIVAQLSQNMNFVMDLTVREFLDMHAHVRNVGAEDTSAVTARCFECANALAGEKFSMDTKLTQLSGGQSRALMIADTAYMSRLPIVLIDEIENAGVDKREAISLLAEREKIVLISTHDPLLALGADKRIVIQNGGIFNVIETSQVETHSLKALERLDVILRGLRRKLRAGEEIDLLEGELLCGNYMTI